jgi:hypothetical protein
MLVEYYSFVDIPQIPEELLDTLDVIEQRKNLHPLQIPDAYATYFVSDGLQEWGQQFFDFKADVRYQVIKKALPVHIDFGDNTFKYNYLLSLGGDDVRTMWWDENRNDENRNLVESFVAPINSWHRINILQPHSISELTSVRLSVTMKKSKLPG